MKDYRLYGSVDQLQKEVATLMESYYNYQAKVDVLEQKVTLIETKCNLLEKKLKQIDAMLATDDGK